MSRSRNDSGRWKRILAVPLGIAAALLLFLAVFYVSDSGAEVVGNTRYTDGEIKQMVFTGVKERNSLYLARIVKSVDLSDVPFMESIDIVYIGHNKVRLHVNENNTIGYVEQKGMDYYFDANGVVLEAIAVEGYDPSMEEEEESVLATSEETIASSEEEPVTGDPLVDLNGDGIYDTTIYDIYLMDTDLDGYPDQTTSGIDLLDTDGDGIPDASPIVEIEEEPEEEEITEEVSAESEVEAEAEATEEETQEVDDGALQAVMERTSDTEFHPALTDVTMVKGLTDEELSVGAVISVNSKTVFSTIQALSKIFSKLEIRPDNLELDEDYEMTLNYGDIKVMIGGDSLLEEKMSRVAAILPKLGGKKGTLHLEYFTTDTVNIVFDEEKGVE